ncbi:HigA family addiction module antitoxin [Candidatus Magnetaquicoccus inordinatus]|uniref:HigA family addiction module antitoxin n=1 Tax=Candidatus Magnetaquicoccus inordinatus TaxID=2496818 RepID=UPI00102B580E|nr:HigA family addiction module antitoxin [Candidatus Magnetaquicoccus inordinatus]
MRIKVHPGEVLREEFMHPHNLSANALAMRLRVPTTRIGAIIHERRSITADTAIRLSHLFGTTPEFWLNLQTQHDLSVMMQKIGDEVKRDVCAVTPFDC